MQETQVTKVESVDLGHLFGQLVRSTNHKRVFIDHTVWSIPDDARWSTP